MKLTKRAPDVFDQVLALAIKRFYAADTAVAALLAKDPFKVLYDLSTAPQSFGTIQGSLTGEDRRKAHEHLLTAAVAWLVAARKAETNRIDHPDLGLPLPAPKSNDAAAAVLKACRALYLSHDDLLFRLRTAATVTITRLRRDVGYYGTVKPALTEAAVRKKSTALVQAAEAFVQRLHR